MTQNEFVIYKTWKSEYRLVCCMLAGMFLSVFLSREFPQTVITGELFTIGTESVYLSLPIFWLVPVAFYVFALIRIYNVKYSLTARGLEMTVGILSMQKRSVRVRYEDIRSVEIMQTILERVLNIGTVQVGTASTSENEITYEGVDSPQEIQSLIQREKGRRISLKNESGISND